MEKRNRPSWILSSLIVLISLLLASCNAPLPTSMSVASTSSTPVEAEGSKTPVPPVGVTITPIGSTDTPIGATGTITLTPGADCDRVQFISDVTFPDESAVDASEIITKTWRVKNVGSCPWDSSYRLVYIRGEQMNGASPAEIITDPVAPGSSVDISIELTVPEVNGVHWGVWQIVNGAGDPVQRADGTPQELSILINVKNGKGGKVTSVRTWSYVFYGVKCTNNVEYDVTANIYADGPVSVGYTWYVSDGLLTVASQNYVFGGAGNVQVTTHISPPFADPNNVRVTLTANGVSASFTICP